MDEPLIDFSKVKKKRPAGWTGKTNSNIIEIYSNKNDNELGDVIIKKAPKKKVGEDTELESNSNIMPISEGEYTYDFLLERITGLIKKHNPTMTDTRDKIKLPMPVINRIGNTPRSAWSNFSEVCDAINRPVEHVYQFIMAELGIEGTIGGEGQFMYKGKFTNKHFEPLLKKYIHEYVQCPNCKSTSTTLRKDNTVRMLMISCSVCKSEKTVQAIKGTVKQSRR